MYELVIAPDPIYKTICTPVTAVDETVRQKLDGMMETCRAFEALGLGAPMVGLTERLVVVELEDATGLHSYKMANPRIIERSSDMQTTEEASLTFLGVSAPVTRPAHVTVGYLDEHGQEQSVRASGVLAACLQHEIDYLDGKTFIDYQSPVKRDMLKRKMEKQKRQGPIPHIHGAHCNH